MKLLVQPEDGVFQVVKALNKARRSIDMHIFRLDQKEIEKALRAARRACASSSSACSRPAPRSRAPTTGSYATTAR